MQATQALVADSIDQHDDTGSVYGTLWNCRFLPLYAENLDIVLTKSLLKMNPSNMLSS